MEGIKDPERLSVEMRKHFQMTEEVLALMLERKKLAEAHAPKTTPPAAAGQAMPSQPGMGRGGMQGGMQGGRPGGGMPGQGMPGGMMQKEMGGMPGGGMQKEMGGMQGGGTGGGAAPGGPMGDLQQMMQRIAQHSTYMETVQDKTVLAQEMLRHQKMLDQMLQLMQQ